MLCLTSNGIAHAETCEIKGHYLDATVRICEDMIKRVRIGSSYIMHDYLTGGFTANTSFDHYCRDNGLLFQIYHAPHAVIDRQNYCTYFRVLAKALGKRKGT
ncbi:hypothetical protein RJ640_021410 [Escallonia rubra]|uniref:Ribulose bisphosphate carboxylase large subunit C-terminal domain-containing protein n=1 Tax=Escallonia rubra TaxID=112253 RepID=A0AA88QUI4_9ASTE|nr:hypothetical protein RJ640_021410 [Escallonia rubra]